MNRKGFTLVELLAVVIILALLTLLASTSVTKLVKDSKEDLSSAQIKLIKSAAEMWGADNLDKLPNSGECGYITLGDLKESGLLDSSIVDAANNEEISNNLKIKITGTTSNLGKLILNYEVNPESVDSCRYLLKTYENGEVVYFNVTTGESCSKTDYTASQSNIGVKSGCMKFYAFNDDGSNTVNLLLDHNTTDLVSWNSRISNASGPVELLTQIASDTGSWIGTETPTNYTIDQSATSGPNYTVDYSTYKARLITAEEIAQITGNTSWDLTNEELTSLSLNSYGWLYDRTSPNCKDYGCSNNSDAETYGYWTVSPEVSSSGSVWHVSSGGYLSYCDSDDFYNGGGVRPVIEVLKSKLS